MGPHFTGCACRYMIADVAADGLTVEVCFCLLRNVTQMVTLKYPSLQGENRKILAARHR